MSWCLKICSRKLWKALVCLFHKTKIYWNLLQVFLKARVSLLLLTSTLLCLSNPAHSCQSADHFNINEDSIISSASLKIQAALIKADHCVTLSLSPHSLSFLMHSSWFILPFFFPPPPTTCLWLRCPRLDLWMALSDKPLWTSSTGEKHSELRRRQNGCFEREGLYYMAKICPKAAWHKKREIGKKNPTIKQSCDRIGPNNQRQRQPSINGLILESLIFRVAADTQYPGSQHETNKKESENGDTWVRSKKKPQTATLI